MPRLLKWIGPVVLFIAFLPLALRADVVKMKDGTVLTGTVIEQQDGYWIKTADGQTRIVSKDDVESVTKGNPAPTGATGAAGEAPSATGSNSLEEIKSKADRCDAPVTAITLWQGFIDSLPSPSDLEIAKQQLAHWKELEKDNAEKINGKWIGGDARKLLLEEVKTLIEEAGQEFAEHQELSAITKLQKAVRLYPKNFRANFALGYYLLQQNKRDDALATLQTAVNLRPDSAEALSNLAIAQNWKKEYEASVLSAYKAAQAKDTKEIVQNLVNALDYAPPGMRANNMNIRPAIDGARVLASKYGISGPSGMWTYVPLPPDSAEGSVSEEAPGVIGNGSGFFISPDGYILTNRHVAKEGNLLSVHLVGGKECRADVIFIDDDQDLALLKIKADKPVAFIKMSDVDAPDPGAPCTALGFPLGNYMDFAMQITSGTVSSVIDADPVNVVVTCKVNPGNSGGPLLDKYGHLIGIVSQKTYATEMIESYGKAIGVGHIRKFLDKVRAKFPDVPAPNVSAAHDTVLDSEAIYKAESPATVLVVIIRTEPGQSEK